MYTTWRRPNIIFKENNFKITISDSDFEYDALDELIEKRGEKPSAFKIDGEKNEKGHEFVSISFERKRTHLFSSFGHENARYLFSKLKDILAARHSKIYKILNPWIYFIPASLLLNIYVQLLSKSKQDAAKIPQWLILITILFTTFWVVSGFYRYIAYQVVLKRRHEGGFWKRNSDKIILFLIGAIIGAFIKYFFDLLLK